MEGNEVVDWSLVDELLFDGNLILAVREVCTATKCRISTAIPLVHARFDKLVGEYPAKFRCDPQAIIERRLP